MNRYRDARLRAGLSQKAAAISLGIRPPSMSDWESGKTKPNHQHLVAMAALYGTTTDYLTGATDNPAPAAGAGMSETTKKKPAAHDGELLDKIITRLRSLPDPDLLQVSAFLDGLQAGQAVAAAAAAAPGPAAERAE